MNALWLIYLFFVKRGLIQSPCFDVLQGFTLYLTSRQIMVDLRPTLFDPVNFNLSLVNIILSRAQKSNLIWPVQNLFETENEFELTKMSWNWRYFCKNRTSGEARLSISGKNSNCWMQITFKIQTGGFVCKNRTSADDQMTKNLIEADVANWQKFDLVASAPIRS